MDKEIKLKSRIDKNFEDFKASMLKLDSQSVFEKAKEITAYTQVHQYMTKSHSYTPEERDYLLLFQNPLEIISDNYQQDLGYAENVLGVIVAEECDRQDGRGNYPMIRKHREPER